MSTVIGVRFKDGGKVYYFDPCGIAVEPEQQVIVETARGIECGRVSIASKEVSEQEIVKPLKKLVRIATPSDIARAEDNRRREARAFSICQQKILDHGLEMKLVEVEYAFDGSKVLFYFTADGRVDFRELVKDLAGVFHTRIELRQIGVRDEAKMLGGLGCCGREFCCSSFLGDFQPVSIRMAKAQGLSLNPTKISGACGRLMCCLKYEQAAYEDLIKTTPRVNSAVTTPDGRGTVTDVSLLTGYLKVRLEDSGEVRVYHKDLLESAGHPPRRETPPREAAEEAISETEPAEAPAALTESRPPRQHRQRPVHPQRVPEEETEEAKEQIEGADAPEKPRRRRRRGGVRHRKPGARPHAAEGAEHTGSAE